MYLLKNAIRLGVDAVIPQVELHVYTNAIPRIYDLFMRTVKAAKIVMMMIHWTQESLCCLCIAFCMEIKV